ncbi:PREDICTED: EPIDERMAL PATTERNING FACTOR-like protein 1 [Tarenaya hassleriana]|uniref:EPIDERMAL PATTERNING FACTOR-like protein 1 n=1 Tax=Tarenaya hassleriana TaxID=28532 RepID=UPI00053C3ED2|nr:PREDICTED: EPIDERMAL PATTERNING FACTOR-like protein 1 [Tarenaya hassleriana]
MGPIHDSVFLLLLLLLPLLVTQVWSFRPPVQPPSPSEEALFEGKTRIGSTPPSCHNRCSGCHPCMAVQVPTLPSHVDARAADELIRPPPGQDRVSDTSSAAGVNQYSNYKPMGWKCHCNGHLYNP